MKRALAAALLAIVALGAGRILAQSPQDDWAAPAPHVRRVNPLANRPDAARGGRKLFRERCAMCHGADARGTSRAPNLADEDIQAQSDGVLFWKISSGNTRTGMPTFSFLPELQRWQLVLHVRSIRNK